MPPFPFSPTVLTLLLTLVFFSFGVVTCWLVYHHLHNRAVLDVPNERSLHTTPVPRGGGLAVMLLVIGGLTGALFSAQDIAHEKGWLVLATTLLAGISWLDDIKGASVIVRLGLHFTAAMLGSLAFTPDQTLFNGAVPFWADRAVMILGWTWFMNLYNFMDGIDGLTCVETICLAAGVGILLNFLNMSDPFTDVLAMLLVGGAASFLLYNWHPARIFLGDVGSVPLGYLTGYLLLILAMHHHLAAALILPLYYLADSGVTLVRRVLRGQKPWHAHREHYYQRTALTLKRHDKVVGWVVLANLLLFLTALLALFLPLPGLALAIYVVAALLYTMNKAAKP